MPAILTTSPFLASSSTSHDSTSTSGVPFGIGLLIALGATIGLVLVPFILYVVISHLIRCCRASRVQREFVKTGNGTVRPLRVEKRGLNNRWPRPSPASSLHDPFAPTALDGVAVSATASSASPYVWKGSKKQSWISPSWSIMFPKHWKTTKRNNSDVSRDCEKGAVLRKESAEDKKENIVSAFMGFLSSWARVEGDGKS